MPFRNNSLFVVTRYRKNEDKLMRMASRLRDGELRRSWFSADRKILFPDIQYPDEQSVDVSSPTSKWSFDEDEIPKPGMVAISADLIEKINQLWQTEPLRGQTNQIKEVIQ